MYTQLAQPSQKPKQTILFQSPKHEQGAVVVLGGLAFALLACASSNPAYGAPMNTARLQLGGSTSPVLARQEEVENSVAREINAIKAAAGLTWLQLAKLLGVSRRSVHAWAEGGEPSGKNLAQIYALVERVTSLADLPVVKIRNQLLADAGIATAKAPESNTAPILFADASPIKHQHQVRRRKTTSSG